MRIHGSLRLGLLLVLSGCSTLSALFEGEDGDLMLHGNDPVAYFSAGRPTPGSRDISTRHNGQTFRFASEENRLRFITSPDRYVPQFDSLSAASMVYAVPEAGEPDAFKIIDGKLYLFGSPRARLYFEMDQEKNLKLAWNYWESEVRDSTRPLQAIRRTIFRVPNYKSEAQLHEEFERRFGRKP